MLNKEVLYSRTAPAALCLNKSSNNEATTNSDDIGKESSNIPQANAIPKAKTLSSSLVSAVSGRISASFPTIVSHSRNGSRESSPRLAALSLPSTQQNKSSDVFRLEIGLENLGNTCFANSSLQCLLHITPLVRFFMETDITSQLNKASPMKGELAASFSDLVHDLCNASTGSYVSPLKFLRTVSIHAPHLLDNQQQDCQEFLRFILDGMCEDLCRRPSIVPSAAVISPEELAMSPSSIRKLQQQQQQQLSQQQVQPQQSNQTSVQESLSSKCFTFDLPSSLPPLTSPAISRLASKSPLSIGAVDKLKQISKASPPKRLQLLLSEMTLGSSSTLTGSRHIVPSSSTSSIYSVGTNIPGDDEQEESESDDFIVAPISAPTIKSNANLSNSRISPKYKSVSRSKLPGGDESSSNLVPSSPSRRGQKNKGRYPRRTGYRLPIVEPLKREDADSSAPNTAAESEPEPEQTAPPQSQPYDPTDLTRKVSRKRLDINEHVARSPRYLPMPSPSQKYTAANVPSEADKAWAAYLKFNDSVVSDMFAGQLQSTIECQTCHNQSYCFDPFLDLSVPIPKNTESKGFLGRKLVSDLSKCSLEDCFEKFVDNEILDGDNMVTCDVCKDKRKCVKRMSIYRNPRILVIHIKRFRFHNYHREKLLTDVNFPVLGLNVEPYLSRDRVSSNDSSDNINKNVQFIYDLVGVSNHSGNMNSGHYVAHVNTNMCVNDQEPRWVCFNDARVSLAHPSNIAGPSAYVLFYRQRGVYEESQKNLLK